MGLSFHDEGTMAECSTRTGLPFCPGYAGSTQEIGRIVHKEPESGCDTIDFQGGTNDINESKR